MTEARINLGARRRLVPVEEADVTAPVSGNFEAEVAAARLGTAQQEQGDIEPEFGIDTEREESWGEGITPHTWPVLGAHVTAPNPLIEAALAVHSRVYAEIFTALILHNGVTNPDVAEFAAEGAQSVADYAATAYRPYDVEA